MTHPTQMGGESECIATLPVSPETYGERRDLAIDPLRPLPTDYLAKNVHGPLMPRIIADNLTWNRNSVRHPVFRQHCRTLCKIPWTTMPDARREHFRRVFAVVEERSMLFFEPPSGLMNISPFLRAAAYADAWERPPEAWFPNPQDTVAEQFQSFFDHLFARYPTPECLTRAWLESGPLHSAARDWFVHVAKGGSLRAAPGFPDRVTRRAAHLAMSAPSTLNVREAIRWGQVHAFGGDERLTMEVLKSRIGIHFEKDRFWLTLIEKLASSDCFDPAMTGMVVDYITYLAEVHASEQRPFSLKQRSVDNLCRQALSTWKRIARQVEKSHEMDDGFFNIHSSLDRSLLLRAVVTAWPGSEDLLPLRRRDRGTLWEVVELCSAFDLIQEGQRMGNCVARYADACLANRCRIWTVRSVKSPDRHSNSNHRSYHATIAIDPRSRVITQARGRFNRMPDRDCVEVISAWCATNRLSGLPACR
ncbi:MAG: PcfJ domain-containing protein [Verrucomicrobiales bacterium]